MAGELPSISSHNGTEYVIRDAAEFSAAACFDENGEASALSMQPLILDIPGLDEYWKAYQQDPEFLRREPRSMNFITDGLTTGIDLSSVRSDERNHPLISGMTADLLDLAIPVVNQNELLAGFKGRNLRLDILPVWTVHDFWMMERPDRIQPMHIDDKQVLGMTLIPEGPTTSVSSKEIRRKDNEPFEYPTEVMGPLARVKPDMLSPVSPASDQLVAFSGGSIHFVNAPKKDPQLRRGLILRWDAA